LNAKNKKYLADSLTNIQAVLDSAGTDDDKSNDEDIDKGSDNIEIVDDEDDSIVATEKEKVTDSDTFEVNEEDITKAIEDNFNYYIGKVSK